MKVSVWREVIAERVRAHAKHGENSLEGGIRLYVYNTPEGYVESAEQPIDGSENLHYVPRWDEKQNRIFVEEVGEISKAMNEFALGNVNRGEYEIELRKEIVQNMAVLSAWLDKLDGRLLQQHEQELTEND